MRRGKRQPLGSLVPTHENRWDEPPDYDALQVLFEGIDTEPPDYDALQVLFEGIDTEPPDYDALQALFEGIDTEPPDEPRAWLDAPCLTDEGEW